MTVCETCKHESEDKNIGRCFYCRNVQDETGDWCEWEAAEEDDSPIITKASPASREVYHKDSCDAKD